MWRRDILIFVFIAIVAGLVPFLPVESHENSREQFPGWPTHYDGKILNQLPLTPLEMRFQDSFPGRIGRFTDGEREIILRWVARETRMLHPAVDCFRGSGYTVIKPGIIVDRDGRNWGKFVATRDGKSLQVTERIADLHGQGWTDVSSWYWAATWSSSRGPWWAITVAEAGGR